jgi:hypothetical protein
VFFVAIFSSFYLAFKFDLIQTAAISCWAAAQFIRRVSYDDDQGAEEQRADDEPSPPALYEFENIN